MSTRTHFEKTAILTLGQLAGLGINFVIPMFLSRWLTIEGYGTYKQLILIHTFLLLTVHMGIDWGLFYFVKRDPRHAPLFSLNVVLVDSCLAVVVIAVGLAGGTQFAALLQNPSLAIYLLAFAPYVFFSIPSHHFTHYLVVRDKIKAAVGLTIAFEVGKTAVILAGYYFFQSLTLVLLGLGAVSLIRYLVLVGWNLAESRARRLPLSALATHLPAQVRFALPLGVSNLITLVLKLDRFIVSALFGLRPFTFYSVGCFELPVVENTVITMADLMSFDMVEARKDGDFGRIKGLWLATLRKIALFHIPLSVFMVFFAHEVITFIYSDAYSESAGYFQVFSLVFLLSAFTPEVVFRVFAENALLLKIRAVSAVYTVGLVIGGAVLLGPLGALYGKLVADLISAALQLTALSRLMRLNFSQWLPWREMARVTAVSLGCAFGVEILFSDFPGRLFFLLALSFSIYGLGVFAVSAVTGILKREEILSVVAMVRRGV